jgi:predicted ArsR family transcriptional regulator
VYSILQKVALDTVRGWNFEVVEALAKSETLSSKQLAIRLGVSKSSIDRKLNNLRELKLITRSSESNNSGARGRHLHKWKLTEKFNELWTKSHIAGR